MCENREIANTVLNLSEFKSPLVNKKGFNIIGTGIGLKFFFRVRSRLSHRSAWLESAAPNRRSTRTA